MFFVVRTDVEFENILRDFIDQALGETKYSSEMGASSSSMETPVDRRINREGGYTLGLQDCIDIEGETF